MSFYGTRLFAGRQGRLSGTWYVDAKTGNNLNAGTAKAPLASPAALIQRLAGTTAAVTCVCASDLDTWDGRVDGFSGTFALVGQPRVLRAGTLTGAQPPSLLARGMVQDDALEQTWGAAGLVSTKDCTRLIRTKRACAVLVGDIATGCAQVAGHTANFEVDDDAYEVIELPRIPALQIGAGIRVETSYLHQHDGTIVGGEQLVCKASALTNVDVTGVTLDHSVLRESRMTGGVLDHTVLFGRNQLAGSIEHRGLQTCKTGEIIWAAGVQLSASVVQWVCWDGIGEAAIRFTEPGMYRLDAIGGGNGRFAIAIDSPGVSVAAVTEPLSAWTYTPVAEENPIQVVQYTPVLRRITVAYGALPYSDPDNAITIVGRHA